MGTAVHVSPETVIAVISKPPSERNKTEIEVLIPWLRKRTEEFKDLDREILLQLVKHCSHERVFKDDVIIKQSDKGDKFYIMLTGRTSVFIDTVKSDDDAPLQLPPEIEEDSSDTDNDQNENGDISSLLHKNKKLDRTKFGKHIIVFEAGKSFGEIALISEDAVRNASIIADDETDMLVIDRVLFNGTLKAKQEAEYRERKHFANTCNLFRYWTPKFRRLTEMSVRKQFYQFDSVMVRQGEPVTGLLFIIKGQGKVVVDPAAHKHQYPKIFEQGQKQQKKLKEAEIQYKKKESHLISSSMNEQIRVRRRVSYASAEKRISEKKLSVCFVDENEVIGDTEVVLGLETHSQTVICTANTEVFILDNKNIDRLITKKNPFTVDQMRDNVESKLKSRLKSSTGSQVELYKYLYNKVLDMKPKKPSSGYTTVSSRPSSPDKEASDPIHDKDIMLSQLSDLFLQDKTPFIEPAVPGTVYYMTKSKERAKRHLTTQLQKRSGKRQSAEVRLQRARRAAIRQPRSRRELEKLTIGTEETRPLQDKDHAVNRFLISSITRRPANPMTATTRHRSEMSVVPGHGHGKPKAASGADDSVFKLTEIDIPEDGQLHIGKDHLQKDEEVKHIVLNMGDQQHERNSSRARIICNMIEQRASAARAGILRPKSAPSRSVDEATQEDENFDPQTSNTALSSLEERIRSFHDKHDQTTKRGLSQIQELRRFNISSPDDVPIPGGTVFVKSHQCKYPVGMYVNPAHHQHVRRYIIPKDAYAIASLSIAAMEHSKKNAEPHPPSAHDGRSMSMPRKRQNTRAQSAPVSRRPQRTVSARSVWN